MRKSIWILIFLIIAIIIGFWIGTSLYKKENIENEKENMTQNITNNNLENNMNIIEIQTSIAEEKISIDTEIIEEVYYIECDHLVRNKIKDINTLINMTKEEIEIKFPDWQIKEFNNKRVILYKEVQSFCNEHYLVKNVNGYVTIYNMDNNDKISEILETTEIETKYLTETDQEDLEEGIMVYTKQKLNKLIEDFE